jgi:DNA invertase Pin-like site-specific DNA recombinase
MDMGRREAGMTSFIMLSMTAGAFRRQLGEDVEIMSSAVIYTRKSSGTEDDSTSLETQEADARALAEKRGFTVTEVYAEGIKSGATITGRPVMQRLLMDIEAGQITNVIAFKWSRMSRDALEGLEIVSRSKRHGVTWHFVHGGLPDGVAGTPMAVMFQAFEGMGAEGERASIKLQTGRGAEQRIIRGGRRNGSKPPYGWQRVDDLKPGPDGKKRPGWTVKQDDETSPVVAEIYHRMAAGSSIRQVVKWLQGSDHETPKGKDPSRWSDTAVKYILSDPTHYGRVVTNRLQRVEGTKSSVLRPESEWRDIPNALRIEPIVDEATWRAATAGIVEHRKPSGGKRSPNNLGLLSYGVARCACPGGPHALSWRRDKDKSGRYKPARYKPDQKNADRVQCPQLSIQADELDEKVWKRVLSIAADPNVLMAQLQDGVAGDTSADELKATEKRLRKFEGEKRNLLDSIRTTTSARIRGEYEADLESVLTKLDVAEAVRDELRARAARADQYLDQGRSIVAELRELEAGIVDLDLEGRRNLLDRLDVKVYVKRKEDVLPGEERFDMDIGIKPPTWMDAPPIFPGLEGPPDVPYTWETLEADEEYERLIDNADWDAWEAKYGILLDKNISSHDNGGDEGSGPHGADILEPDLQEAGVPGSGPRGQTAKALQPDRPGTWFLGTPWRDGH